MLTGASAARAVLTLSTQADRLFEDASSSLKLSALVSFLQQIRRASQAQIFTARSTTTDYSLAMPGESRCGLDRCVSLHLVRLGEAALRLARDRTRPLLHLMRAWSVVAPHLVEAACHRERHISQKAVCFIHDLLTEVLSSWAEPPHFHFNEALFRPFQHILQLELCDEDVQDQVVASLGQLVEACSPQILSGWRPLFSALRTLHTHHAERRLGGPSSPVLDVFEAFISTESSQVFASAASDYIMCLIRLIKGLGEEIGDCVHTSTYGSTDLCLPALDYLHRCSQLLAKIYKMATKPMFLGARLAGLSLRSQGRSSSPEDPLEGVLQEFDDQTGLIQVWILLLEQLTAAVSNCPRQHQAPTLQLLFTLLRELTCVPGPGFALLAVVQLLLPVMTLWLQRSHGDHSYWDVAGGNFKHAIGLSCELVVDHLTSLSQSGHESLLNGMLRDLLKLLVSCVSEPSEPISRVGCSCIRYVLVSGGPVFTEDMWRLACCALQDAFCATLEPVKKLLLCFRTEGSCGDACEVKVAAPPHSASAEAEYWRIRAMAQQVFLLDSQCSPKTPNHKEGFEHAQSCLLIIELPADGLTQRRIPFRNIVVSLLSHQVLLQNLYDTLLEEAPPPNRGAPGTSGFLPYLSMSNLAVLLDLLRDSYKTARDFDARPGLKYLLMKVSGVSGPANLYRQSAMSFSLYFQTLLCALLSQSESLTSQQVKALVFEEEEVTSDSSQPGSASSEDEDIFEETAQVSPPRGRVRRPTWSPPRPAPSPSGGAGGPEWAWLVRRLQRLCVELSSSYTHIYQELEGGAESRGGGGGVMFLPLFPSETSTPTSCRSTPLEEGGMRGHGAELTSPGETTPTPSPGVSGGASLRLCGGEAGREWWEGPERSLGRLLQGYKQRRRSRSQQARLNLYMASPDHTHPDPAHHAASTGPGGPGRSRSGSAASSSSSSLKDQQAQSQAWTNMVLAVLNQVLMLSDASFVALQAVFYPCFSELTCSAQDPRLRAALGAWLQRLGGLYDITP